jgi:NNP family nitrate/nitrite transporter-like MFS transporter
VGAGGNVGAVGAGFLMKWVGSVPDTLFLLGWIVLGCATCAISVRFTMTYSQTEQLHYDEAVTQRRNLTIQGGIAPAN